MSYFDPDGTLQLAIAMRWHEYEQDDIIIRYARENGLVEQLESIQRITVNGEEYRYAHFCKGIVIQDDENRMGWAPPLPPPHDDYEYYTQYIDADGWIAMGAIPGLGREINIDGVIGLYAHER